ncbi:MAG: hypothetical protein V2I63_00295 [Pseudomonadales bacterium]|jgi:cytochrome bd-type quinol oxidase subunit 2|nr:hypothetical protein [Pseudomonadales bacterium]
MILKAVLAVAALAFCILLGTTLLQVGTEGTEAVTATRWGQVTLADFYLGVLCFSVVIALVERSALRALPWGVALALLGYPVGALWLILRGLPRLRDPAPGP